jgi:hypothetical protein
MSGTKMSMRSNCLQKKKLNYSSQRLRSRWYGRRRRRLHCQCKRSRHLNR